MNPDVCVVRKAIRDMGEGSRADIEMIVRCLHICGALPASELMNRMISVSSEAGRHGMIERARDLGLIREAKMMFPASRLGQRWRLAAGVTPQTLDPDAPPSPFTREPLPSYY